ncbi:polysaccharide lyase family 4 protein [Plenodomus tracheiphilus IPT5]|uniref:rhamnogalacturonan endolyase n=1 Tax=Plenodomus tracheiphilus IPT5 TaxID=1408161 RepID=A0A6A7B253_9PLEO|nr:polysaccharide lyase family 4 protein [Plenodomus tracheiphilus IPT5]
MFLLQILIAIFTFIRCVCAEFGTTETRTSISVDTGAGLIFGIDKSSGDINSLKYNGTEYQGTGNDSRINSGLGASDFKIDFIDAYIVITAKSSKLPITQYYIAKEGDASIYMATTNDAEVREVIPEQGIDTPELRFTARFRAKEMSQLDLDQPGIISDCDFFEGKDVFMCGLNRTASRFYTAKRVIDNGVGCVSGPKAQACLIVPQVAFETSSGGPFMREPISEVTLTERNLFWYMHSDHVRTEESRTGLKGPYALTFTAAGAKAPETFNTDFLDSLKFNRHVTKKERGSVTGEAVDIPGQFETVLHWFNKDAQYWAKATNENYTSPMMKPGTYTMNMYRREFLVNTVSVEVSAGKTTTADIAPKAEPPFVWRIGEFDGQPFELQNGDKITRMHPADSRMQSWGGNFTIGNETAKDFPMALWRNRNSTEPVMIDFNLNKEEVKKHVLRIGTTLAYKDGRPSVKIGDWTGKDHGAPKVIGFSGLTHGAYRGFGDLYTWDVPASAFTEGTNTLTLGVHGNDEGDWLSASYIVDALELQV